MNKQNLTFHTKYYLKLFSLPLSFLLLCLSLWVVWHIFKLPSADVLANTIKSWFDTYGLPVVFLSAIIEGMLLIGGYFPGVFIIFIGVVLANSPYKAVAIVVTGSLGLLVAHIINYLLGKYGWYAVLVKFGLKSSIEEAQQKLIKRGSTAIFSSYWMPSMSAFTDTAAGILHMEFRKFIMASIGSMIFWNSLVGFIVYNLKEKAASAMAPGGSSDLLIQLLIVFVWIAILLIIDIIKKVRNKLPNNT